MTQSYRDRQPYAYSLYTDFDRDHLERAIAHEQEFQIWLQRHPENLELYVESLGDDRSVLCNERWEVC